MRLHVTVTDTGESATFSESEGNAPFHRFVANSLASLAVSEPDADGYDGPAVIIRWIPEGD